MENFLEYELDLNDVICGGTFEKTNQGCPEDADYYDTDTGRYFWVKQQ